MAMDDVAIGDFSKPLSDKKQAPPAPAAAPTKERLENAEKKLDAEASEAERTLKPRLSYEERLKEAGLTKEQAAEIVDNVLFKGYHSQEFNITPRMKIRLRTRQLRDTQRAQMYLEVSHPTYDTHYNEILMRYNAAASLEKWGNDVFEFPKKDDPTERIEQLFTQRLEYVNGLADPAVRLLFSKCWAFDRKIIVALEEGAIENF
jgi:hypothetical protein